ncbi:MAG: hypothetical protein Q9163_004379 [Psora crenata]
MPFGVSNSFKRGTIKTYSRQKARLENSYDAEGPRKRICMDATGAAIEKNLKHKLLQVDEKVQLEEPDDGQFPETAEESASSSLTAPSSPLQADGPLLSSDPFEDEDSPLSSAPSSPPSRFPSPVVKTCKPTFSLLKRKRPMFDGNSKSLPLHDITPNARKSPPPRTAKKAMMQMQIDLGGDIRKTCRMCGMEYMPSVKQDATVHKEFCGVSVAGIAMSRAFCRDESLRRVRSARASGREREEIIVVDRRSSQAARNKVRKVLHVVNAELSAAVIEDEVLWNPFQPESIDMQAAGRRTAGHQEQSRVGDRFKAFLYMVGERCVGFCLAEKISNAHAVIDAKTQASSGDGFMTALKSSSISVSATPDVALMGIARIWTAKSFRARGLALDLLECARGNFFYGLEVPKNLVAFSQPTESGGRLAERWFDMTFGWHVYQGDQ